MATLWFILVALMLTAYVVLDGFDLGAGVISIFVARGPEQRNIVLKTIGPVWDGNEVWLIAAGGALYFAFPVLYASAFSGFYLPLMIVLWLLMLRGIGIELRSHLQDPMWWSAFDFVFAASSFLLVVFFGAAIGNVMRGVPLEKDGFFFEALWTDFRVGPQPGILDWYTSLTALLALAALIVHGACYVATKTEGAINMRCRQAAAIGWPVLAGLTIASLAATLSIRPQVLENFRLFRSGWIIPIAVGASLICIRLFLARGRDQAAFLSSAAYLVSMLAGAALALYPTLLPASTDPSYSLTIDNARTGDYSLHVGLVWWIAGIVLAIGYFIFLYTAFRGKVKDYGTVGRE
jgi:cytochrome d ubiquinol oxidase subunit II